jgi:hypothetical protein
MTRNEALPYVSFALDDALAVRTGEPIPEHARLIGWQCGFEPLFVAVWSYIPGVRLDDDEAEDIARDYLIERQWFADSDEPPYADYVI